MAKKIKERYISHNLITGEIYYDKFNIDYLRYFKRSNLFFTILGTIIGAFLFIQTPLMEYVNSIDIGLVYLFFIGGGFIWFLFTTTVAYFAVGSIPKAARIAGRRGLFTFVVMAIVAILSLSVGRIISWDLNLYYFLKFFMSIMIVEGLLALTLGYGVSYIKGKIRKNR